MAYLGDSVFEILVRERLVLAGITPDKLHEKSLLFVRASEQSKAIENIKESLNEVELDLYKRGRNAKGRVPKSSSVLDYRRATGLECLFGYLYLNGKSERLRELFNLAFGEDISKNMANKEEKN